MGKTARKMVGNVDDIVKEMNKALADEWLAYMQYVSAAALVNAPPVEAALKDVAKEELEHAEELTERILQLGGKPIADPKQFLEKTNCGYEVPTESVVKALKDAIKGEGCAIGVYSKIAKMTKDTDPITHQLILHIMSEEEEHEERFENLLDFMSCCQG